ncbi:MAG: EAL domain-containing protein [Gammaproteobacteria bacterium]|nr:EAL domain-containing protein [Gammaproteobacteria bacterium]
MTKNLGTTLRGSLRWRIFLFFLALIGLIMAAVLGMVYRTTYGHTLAQIREQLQAGYGVLDNAMAARSGLQRQVTATIAGDYGLKDELVNARPDSAESLTVALDNYRRRGEAGIALATDPERRVLASTDSRLKPGMSFPRPELLQGEAPADALLILEGRLFHVTATPVFAPRPNLIGYLVMGFAIDDAEALRLARLTGSSLSLFGGTPAAPVRLAASEAEGPAQRLLALAPAGVSTQASRDGEYVVYRAELSAAGTAPIQLLMHRSLTDALSDYRALSLQLLAIVLFALGAAGIGAFLVASTVSRPIQAMVDYVRRIGSGDYAARPPEERRGEVGVLAKEFAAMQAGIAEREAAISHLAYHDPLTGLPNRNRFQLALAEALAARHDATRLAVLVMDLDRFKDINDTLGHLAGDELLQQAARRLEQCRREGDVLARLGGDEFALLVPQIGARDIIGIGLHYREAFAAPFALEGIELEVAATVGVAVCPEHGEQAGTLLQHAEVAMYVGKGKRLPYCIYNSKLDHHSLLRLSLMGELKAAIERGELALYVQPKLDIAAGQIAGLECLVRWVHPVHGFIPPDEFIPLAEQTGAVRHLTAWVLDEAMAWAARWRTAGHGLKCAVNLSAVDLMDRGLHDLVEAGLKRHGLPPEALVLEVTESAVMSDPDKAVALLGELKAAGLRLSIDDYGTGYSSMAQLKRLPVHELKIDKSFVLDVVNNPDDAIIVRSTIELGHNMALSVVAEGVESAEALRLLGSWGCDLAQGYHLSKPMPAKDFLAWLEHSPWPAKGRLQEVRRA